MVAPSSKNEKYVVLFKGMSFLKKISKQHQNRPINCDTIHVRTMHLLNEPRAGGRERDKRTTNIGLQTPYFRTYSRRA